MTSRVTTHVLDAVSGQPAVGVHVTLEQHAGKWRFIADGSTDADGRITDFGPPSLPSGIYRATFDTGAYFSASGQATFYPEVIISFTLRDPQAHYHVPLLLSPFAYSTYRGS